jgi:hypothetical protein
MSMLARYHITLAGLEDLPARPHHLHAAMCARLGGHDDPVKPWAVAPPRRATGADPAEATLEVRTLTAEATSLAPVAFAAGDAIRLGRQLTMVAEPPSMTAMTPWADLATPGDDHKWELEFHSPASFGHHSRYSPLPQPAAMIRSLATRWNALCPPQVRIRPLAPEELLGFWVSDVSGRTVVERIPHMAAGDREPLIVPGFVGRVMVRASDDNLARLADCLFRFAEYAGVGSYVGHGLGTVQLVDRRSGGRGDSRHVDRE